ncbi:tetraspanin-6-like [Periplaneta americana]|uniref:tetraspanin-6-like n=1 Tax=Periplaneta americana TaxID=6978 RepID=UPI0037E88C1D
MLKESMENSMKAYGDSIYDQRSWDSVQTKLECCALEGPSQWKAFTNKEVPQSCLVPDTKSRYFKVGCYSKITEIIKDGIAVINGIGIGLAIFKVMGIIIVFLLALNIRAIMEC